VIDLHAHILPGLDDGPGSFDAAVVLARTAVEAGTRAIATTSHINRSFGLAPADLAAVRAELAARLDEEGVELDLLAGGEIAPDRLPQLDDDALDALTLGGGPYLLIECPFAPVGASMEPIVNRLRARGFEVLLAHPERSVTFQRDPERLAALVRLGALAQVTAGALAGGFGGTAQRAARTMLERGLVHVLASDAHDAVHRPPVLRAPGVEGAQLEWMASAAPAAIVEGRPLPGRPPLPPGRRRRWLRA
jgi:protein-tyrosine phosphatase